MTEGQALKQGYLVKKGAKRKNWKTRWFILRGSNLEYYQDAGDPKPRGMIPLDTCNCQVELYDKKANAFKVETKNRTFYIVAGNATLRDQWIEAIKECILNK